MRNNRLPSWTFPVVILAGIALLIVGIVNFLTAPAPPPSRPETSAAQTTVLTAIPSPSPSATQQSFPLASPTVIVPTATVAPPTSTPTSTPSPVPPIFDGEIAYQHVLAQVEIGPRPTGSEAGWATGDFIMTELGKVGWPAETQEFIFKGVKGRNIVGKRGSGPIIILGAHYDTRPAADHEPEPTQRGEWILGANDGASGVAVLLELARVLEIDKLKNEVWLTFFDAEDRGRLADWPFSVGARHMAENLSVNPQRVIVVDMIGDADQNIYFERNSTEALRSEIWTIAAELGYEAYFIPELKHTIIDDHLPFLERGIPAIDIIDFDYPYWHTIADTADKVAPESLEHVGRTLEVWLEEKQ